MTRAELEQYVKERIYPNNAQEITGEALQDTLLAIVASLLQISEEKANDIAISEVEGAMETLRDEQVAISGEGAGSVILKGDSNEANGELAIAGGADSYALAPRAIALGNSCAATSFSAIAMGDTSNATAEGAVAIGWGNQADGEKSFCCGSNNQTTKEGEFACGKHNKTGPDIIFSVGNGIWNGAEFIRANAFEIRDTNVAYLFNRRVLTTDDYNALVALIPARLVVRSTTDYDGDIAELVEAVQNGRPYDMEVWNNAGTVRYKINQVYLASSTRISFYASLEKNGEITAIEVRINPTTNTITAVNR